MGFRKGAREERYGAAKEAVERLLESEDPDMVDIGRVFDFIVKEVYSDV